MVRPKLPAEKRKRKITITPAPEVLDWIDSNVGLGKRFKDRTHAFEYAVSKMMEGDNLFNPQRKNDNPSSNP